MITSSELNALKSKYKIPEITVDFLNSSYNTVYSKQLDNARYLICTLTENGSIRAAAASENARIRMKKPDDSYIYNDCQITDTGKVLVHFTEQMMAREGNACCDIQLTSSAGDIYSTQTFYVTIGSLPYSLNALESRDDLSSINELLAKEKERLKDVEELKATVESSEKLRENAETNRANAEKARTDAENKRTENEAARTRNENSRIQRESTRESNESKRILQETQRQTNTEKAIENAENAAEYAVETATELQNKIDENYFVFTDELVNSISSTSTTAAPTANAVKKAYEQAKSDSNSYTDQKIADLVNGAPETMDTLKEVADAIAENKDVEKALNQAIGTKADKTHTHTEVNGHTVDSDVPADAKFTDTVYTHPLTSGNRHIPSGGSSGQTLIWASEGTARWGTVSANGEIWTPVYSGCLTCAPSQPITFSDDSSADCMIISEGAGRVKYSSKIRLTYKTYSNGDHQIIEQPIHKVMTGSYDNTSYLLLPFEDGLILGRIEIYLSGDDPCGILFFTDCLNFTCGSLISKEDNFTIILEKFEILEG